MVVGRLMDQGQALPSTRRHSLKSKQYVEVSGDVGRVPDCLHACPNVWE